MRCKAGKFVFLVFASFLILTVGVSGARAVFGHDEGAFSEVYVDEDIFNGNQTHIIKGASPRIITVGHTPDADYWYIQDAINASKDGDIIEVWYGTYIEDIVINKSITLRSRDGANMTVIKGKRGGITVTADNVTIIGFTIEDAVGIKIDSSNNSIVKDNIIRSIYDWGIYVESSDGITISNNTISSVGGAYDSYGIRLYSSSGNTITNNTIKSVSSSNTYGYGICLSYSSGNTITNNTIKSVSGGWGGYGIYLTSGSVMNLIYHNNIIDCETKGGYDSAGNNVWDAGPIKGGNYWSDYKGEDTDKDGIGDTPYELGGGSGAKDFYPFMNESGWLERKVPSVSISTDKYEYIAGEKMLISIILENPTDELQDLEFLWRLDIPDYNLSFPVINNKSLSLPPGFKKTFVVSWTLPNLSVSFNASWYVALYDGIISEDTADWRYIGAKKKGERDIAIAKYLREIERSVSLACE